MKLFRKSQEYMAIIGVRPLWPGEKMPFNCQNVGVFLIFLQTLIMGTAFLVFDAQTLREYTECLFAWISVIAIFVGMILVVIRTQAIFQIIKNLENMVEQSK